MPAADSEAETEADLWAEDIIYGPGGLEQILRNPPHTRQAIEELASQIDVHPGIIVGMLQHYKKIDFSTFNSLKMHFHLTESEQAAGTKFPNV